MSISTTLPILVGMLILAIIVWIFYSIIKRKDSDGSNSTHAYFYLVSFVTLGILFWAVSDLFRIFLGQYVFDNIDSYKYSTTATNTFLRGVVARLVTILVTFPIWGFHWIKANPVNPEELDKRSRRSYSLSVVIVSMVFTLAGWPYLIYVLVSGFLEIESKYLSKTLSIFLPYTILATILWIIHFRIWRKLSEKNNLLMKDR